jgi:hypothetical protein
MEKPNELLVFQEVPIAQRMEIGLWDNLRRPSPASIQSRGRYAHQLPNMWPAEGA